MSENKLYAVIDTNVFVSALLSQNKNSNPATIMRAIFLGKIIPLYNKEIIAEYNEVLRRDKFSFNEKDITTLIYRIINSGVLLDRTKTQECFIDKADIVFYEVKLSKDDSFLVTGNLKHFPKNHYIVSPAEMVKILENSDLKYCIYN